jgi:pectinesterase
MEALAAYPKGYKGRYFMYVKAGVYEEYIIVPKDCVNLLMYGDGPQKTVITGHKNKGKDNIDIVDSASFGT